MKKSIQIFFPVVCAALLPLTAAADTISLNSNTIQVTVDTSSIARQIGYIDLQFEPTAVYIAASATAQLQSTNATLGAASLTGDVSGLWPGTLQFFNDSILNDYFQALTFGTNLTFQVNLGGLDTTSGPDAAFNISFFASDGSTPLLTTSPDGLAVQLAPAFPGVTGTTYGPGITLTPIAPTPEPAQLGLIGLAVIGGSLRFRKRSR